MDDNVIENVLRHCAKCIQRYEDINATEDDRQLDEELLSDLMDGLHKKTKNMADQWKGRCGYYFWFALNNRLDNRENEIYNRIKTSPERHWGFNPIIPSRKFSYDSSVLLIFEAMRNFKKIHIVDFEIGAGVQWGPFIRRISTIPGGPPTLKISAMDGPGVFNEVAAKLTPYAESVGVDLQFQDLSPIAESNHLLARKILRCDDEGLAINFPFTMKQSTSIKNQQILRFIKKLKPNVVILTELEINHDIPDFYDLFEGALRYYRVYMQTLNSQDWGVDKYRSIAESQTVAKQLVGVLAHNQLEWPHPFSFWADLFKGQGFSPAPPSAVVLNRVQKKMPRDPLYSLVNKDDALFFNWDGTHLVSCSAWTPSESVAGASTSAAGAGASSSVAGASTSAAGEIAGGQM